MPPVVALHVIGAFFLNGRGQVGLTYRRFLCFRRACGGVLFLLPLSVASQHLPPRDAAYDAFALDRCRLLRWQGPDWTDAPAFLCFRRAYGGLSFLLPLSVAIYAPLCSPVRCCVNIYVHSLCRAAGVLEWQESGGRARASCSQRCAATGRVRCVRCRRRDGGYLSRSYSDVARASVASSRCSFRASPFGMCSSPVPALLSRCFCDTAT